MTLKNIFAKVLLICTVAVFLTPAASAQSEKPVDSRLLNGLRLLVFKKSDSDKITLKLRIHSGSAFDPLGKEGTMSVLTRILFPNQELRDFFKDDLGGGFSIASNYDYIQIDASAKSDKLIEMLEPIASGLTNPQINRESTSRAKVPAAQEVANLESDRVYSASIGAAHNLVGNFPYGRSDRGTTATIGKIDFADLMQAEERFLTSDNATLIISGNVDPAYTLKVVKRLFGGWTKADKKVPPTFAQPDLPKQSVTSQELTPVTEGTLEIRSAVRGLSRKDPLYPAYLYLEKVIQGRLAEHHPGNSTFFVTGIALQPVVVFGVTGAGEALKDAVPSAMLMMKDVTEAEFARAQEAVLKQLANSDPLQAWLDCDTYGLESADKEIAKVRTVTIVDVQNALNALRKAPAVTTVFTAPKKSDK